MRRAIDSIGIVLGVVALSVLAIASTTLVSAGAALMTFAAIYAVLINETVD